jgi:3' terminal RNA ribose 2'-O-methyltransferase Hen1
MFISIATTHRPATDLGFLLMKHPQHVHETELTFGRATVFYPEASEERCEAALILDVDPVGLVRGRGEGDGLLSQYVNDRPYVVSSFMSVALTRVFRTAMTGVSRERQEVADAAMPLEIRMSPLPVRSGVELVSRLFEPLGWQVQVERIPGKSGSSRYADVRLTGTMRLAVALGHIYVLIPVLDEEKHYWVGDDEVEKLLSRAEAWLPTHPERETIVRRYLKGRRNLMRQALARLAPEEAEVEARSTELALQQEEVLETPLRLHDLRLDTVTNILAEAGARVVVDLGCGEGKLLQRLVRDKRFEQIIGLDASVRELEKASARLKLDMATGPEEGRVTLLHGALTYRDERWHAADAAALVEVIEHMEPGRLPALEGVVFGAARPRLVVLTTPNAEYNALFPTLPAGEFRHKDHRFEWTRAQFQDWANGVAVRHGYDVSFSGIGEEHPEFGAVSQMAVFTR